MDKPKLIIIAGPTAVGKSASAVALAERIGGEVVSADSMQVYRGMDIGTAKVTAEEMRGVKHYLIDIIDPTEEYNVVKFKEMAEKALCEIYSKDKIPILCGGTGFYIQALLYDIDFTEESASASENIRASLTELYEKKGAAYLHDMLKAIDIEASYAIPVNNVKRTIRAIEFYRLHGKKISEHNKAEREKESRYDSRFFVLTDDRRKLYERIDGRVDRMLENGLIDEVRGLMERGVDRASTAMQGIGYREIYAYLSGELSKEEATELIKRNSRHYAKRQLTWFKREKNVITIDIGNMLKGKREGACKAFIGAPEELNPDKAVNITGDIANELEKYLW